MTQRDRFREPTIEPIAAPRQDKPRLRGQNAAILAALQKEPQTNRQLAARARRFWGS